MKKGLMFLCSAIVLAMVFAGCASTAAVSNDKAAANGAAVTSGSTVNLWNFESKTADGWYGKGKWADAVTVNSDPKFVKEGKYTLKIDAKTSKGWNQDIAMNDGPFPEQFQKLKAIDMDVYVPAESVKGLEYSQIFIVISGSANSWYQVPQGLKPGWNSLEYKMETDNISGDIWHVYFVFNCGGAFAGPVYIDNVVGKY
jgi:hypothetical protein